MSTSFRLFVCLASLTASAVGTSPALAAAVGDDTPSDSVAIEVVTVSGSGCLPGTAAVAMSPDNHAFTMTYSDYTVKAGPKVAARDNRKACQLSLDVKVPEGYSYAVVKADYRGHATLAAGASGKQIATYFFQGSSADAKVKSDLTGPFDDDFLYSDKVASGKEVWSPCGETRYLNVKSELRVSKGSSTEESTMTMDSTDGSIDTTYQLAWKKC